MFAYLYIYISMGSRHGYAQGQMKHQRDHLNIECVTVWFSRRSVKQLEIHWHISPHFFQKTILLNQFTSLMLSSLSILVGAAHW